MGIRYCNDQNQRYSKQLFWEEWIRLTEEFRTTKPVFSLYTDKPGCVNFGSAYIEDADPTGYKTSKRFFDNYDFFTHLMKSRWFREAKDQWDREIDAKLTSEGLDKIRELAKGTDAKALSAAKFLAKEQYKNPSGKKRGRPSNDEIAGTMKNILEDDNLIQADFERIRKR